MRIFRAVWFAGWIYPGALFRIDTREKLLCLTFDDGPDPGSTPALLELLSSRQIRCIFFCNGKNAEKHPELISAILNAGHIIGNHGYSHPDGWKTKTSTFIEDVGKAEKFTSGSLFRPPFGRMKPAQLRLLKKKYTIVLWDLMPYDFDSSFGPENVLKILKNGIRPGSVIVLHDSKRSCALEILPEFIDYAVGEGYSFVNTV
jgi:peptidoglycan-N-acetylglucosamine deacetylase